MNFETIIFEKSNSIGIVTLNRPKVFNALSSKLVREMTEVLDNIARDDEINSVIITGSNGHFCCGADVKEMPVEVTDPQRRLWLCEVLDLFGKIEELEKPVVMSIDGYCLGGGLELAIAGDLRIASTNARFGSPEIMFGGIPAGGAPARLPRLIGVGKTKEMLYMGEQIDAEEAYRVGLVNKVVNPEALKNETIRLARDLADKSASALKLIKFCINLGIRMDHFSAIEVAHQIGPLVGTPEEIAAAKEKAATKSKSYSKMFRKDR